MRRLLADLHAAGLLGYDTLEVWQYDNTDVTKDKVRSRSCVVVCCLAARRAAESCPWF